MLERVNVGVYAGCLRCLAHRVSVTGLAPITQRLSQPSMLLLNYNDVYENRYDDN